MISLQAVGNIPVYDLLNGTTASVFDRSSNKYFGVRDDKIVPVNLPDRAVFKCIFDTADIATFKLQTADGRSVVVDTVNNDELIIVNQVTNPPAGKFYFSRDIGNSASKLDLTTTTLNDFSSPYAERNIYMKNFSTMDSVGMMNEENGPYRTIEIIPIESESDPRKSIVIVPEALTSYAKVADDVYNSQSRQADCCMGKVDADGKKACDALEYVGGQSKCDAVMNSFCTEHPDNDYCGCYNVESTVAKLGYDMKEFSSDLIKQPNCWIPTCKTGYQNKTIRDVKTCDIQTCADNVQAPATGTIYRTADGQMLCRGSTPIVTDVPVIGLPNTESSNMFIILFIVIIVAAIVYYSYGGAVVAGATTAPTDMYDEIFRNLTSSASS